MLKHIFSYFSGLNAERAHNIALLSFVVVSLFLAVEIIEDPGIRFLSTFTVLVFFSLQHSLRVLQNLHLDLLLMANMFARFDLEKEMEKTKEMIKRSAKNA